MTLSPNAQEFIPIAFSIPPIQTFVLDPSNGTTSPVILSHIPLNFGSTSYYVQNNVVFSAGPAFYPYPSNLPTQSVPAQNFGQSTRDTHQPYIADQKMYQKVFKNVSLIKQTIECHYNNQNQTFYKNIPKFSYKNKKPEKNVPMLNDNDFPPIQATLNIEPNSK